MTAPPADNPNLIAALNLAAAGLRVFPAGPDKRPLLAGWQEKATTEEEQIRTWWDGYPPALPAIVVGRAGLVVIDCDRHPGGSDGIEVFNRLLSTNGANLADVPITKTANGGAHLFFKQPKGEPLGNGRGELPNGIDVRGVGGFVIAPGAVLPNGKRWQSVNGRPSLADAFKAATIPELPQWLAYIIRPNRQSTGGALDEDARGFADMPGTDSRSRGEAYAAAALDGAVSELSAAPTGKRNETLNAFAFRLGRAKTDWIEIPNTWGCFIGRPGMLKSPAMNEALRPIHRLEAEAAKENEIAQQAYEAGLSVLPPATFSERDGHISQNANTSAWASSCWSIWVTSTPIPPR